MPYVPIINIPGYPPMDSDPPRFDNAADAWGYLVEKRMRIEDEAEYPDHDDSSLNDCGYSPVVEALEAERAWHKRPEHVCDEKCIGAHAGPTPGYDGEHDLGWSYSVRVVA